MEYSLPQYYLKHKHLQDIIEKKLSLALCIKEMVEQQVRDNIKILNQKDMWEA
jgi:hypothetical protein